MPKYLIKYDMGFSGTDTDFDEIEIPEGEDPEGNDEIAEALSEACAEAAANISAWYELADEE